MIASIVGASAAASYHAAALALKGRLNPPHRARIDAEPCRDLPDAVAGILAGL